MKVVTDMPQQEKGSFYIPKAKLVTMVEGVKRGDEKVKEDSYINVAYLAMLVIV